MKATLLSTCLLIQVFLRETGWNSRILLKATIWFTLFCADDFPFFFFGNLVLSCAVKIPRKNVIRAFAENPSSFVTRGWRSYTRSGITRFPEGRGWSFDAKIMSLSPAWTFAWYPKVLRCDSAEQREKATERKAWKRPRSRLRSRERRRVARWKGCG